MSKTLTVSDEVFQTLIEYSIKQTAPEQSTDEFFNAMECWGQYDDTYDGGVEDGNIEMARRILESAKAEEERK